MGTRPTRPQRGSRWSCRPWWSLLSTSRAPPAWRRPTPDAGRRRHPHPRVSERVCAGCAGCSLRSLFLFSLTETCRFEAAHCRCTHTGPDDLTCSHRNSHPSDLTLKDHSLSSHSPFSFTHLSERRRVTFESKLPKLVVSAVWSLISLSLLLRHPHPWQARF